MSWFLSSASKCQPSESRCWICVRTMDSRWSTDMGTGGKTEMQITNQPSWNNLKAILKLIGITTIFRGGIEGIADGPLVVSDVNNADHPFSLRDTQTGLLFHGRVKDPSKWFVKINKDDNISLGLLGHISQSLWSIVRKYLGSPSISAPIVIGNRQRTRRAFVGS